MRQLLRDNLERHLRRLEDEFPQARFAGPRAATSRVLAQDLRRALDLDDDADIATAAPELRERTPSVWSGLWSESPSILLREHPARTADQVQGWLDHLNWMTASETGFGNLNPEAFVEAYGPRAPLMAKALLADVNRRLASTGSGTPSDPFLGPWNEARSALAAPEGAQLEGVSEGPLGRGLRAKTGDWFSAVRNLSRVLESRGGERTVTYLTGKRRERWIRRFADALGEAKGPAELDALARSEVTRLTEELGESLGLEDPSDLEATRLAFGQIRTGSRIVPGANLPLRSPLELSDLLRGGLPAFAAAAPTVLFASSIGRTFERPHGRWKPCVPGDLRPPTDPVARPFVYLRPRQGDPTVPRWLWEAEAVRYGIRGEALVDAYRRSAVDQSLYVRSAPRGTFESAWGLYAVAEVFHSGELRESDRGFGWRVQELCAFAAVVVDIGMHDRGWSYRQAVDAFLEMAPVPEALAEEAVLRSIAEPGRDAQGALALTRIRNLRGVAEDLLGGEFPPAEFHSALLARGPAPMTEIAARVESWLETREPGVR